MDLDAYDGPILDNHLHLDWNGAKGLNAVEEFATLGGTHLLIVNQPSWKLDVKPTTGEEFRPVFETTIELAHAATERLPGRAWPVLGVHPGLISHLQDRGLTVDEAKELMQAGLDVAAEYVRRGDAVALKSGRPHYDVDDAVWDASNAVMRHAFRLGSDLDCAVQLHTEGGDSFEDIATWAANAGLDQHQVVKHYAQGPITGLMPSIISAKEHLKAIVEAEVPFLMETDYLDDPDRPGAVLGLKTVPRRVRWLLENGHDEAVRRAHVETPATVYGIDTEATLQDPTQ